MTMIRCIKRGKRVSPNKEGYVEIPGIKKVPKKGTVAYTTIYICESCFTDASNERNFK